LRGLEGSKTRQTKKMMPLPLQYFTVTKTTTRRGRPSLFSDDKHEEGEEKNLLEV